METRHIGRIVTGASSAAIKELLVLPYSVGMVLAIAVAHAWLLMRVKADPAGATA